MNAVNMGHVGQRAAKLLAGKFGVLKKKSATSPLQTAKVRINLKLLQTVSLQPFDVQTPYYIY